MSGTNMDENPKKTSYLVKLGRKWKKWIFKERVYFESIELFTLSQQKSKEDNISSSLAIFLLPWPVLFCL